MFQSSITRKAQAMLAKTIIYSNSVEVYPKINEHLKKAIQAKFNQTSNSDTYPDIKKSPTIYLSKIDDYYRRTDIRKGFLQEFAQRAEKLPTFKSKDACDEFLQAMDTMWNNGLLFQDGRNLTENEQSAYTLLTDVLNENIQITGNDYKETFNNLKKYCKKELIKPDVIPNKAQTRAVDYLIAKSIFFYNHGGLSFNHQAFLRGYATLLNTTGSASQLQGKYDNVLGNMQKAIKASQAAKSTYNIELTILAISLTESCGTRFLRLLQTGRERSLSSLFFLDEAQTNTGQVSARIDEILKAQSNTSMAPSN